MSKHDPAHGSIRQRFLRIMKLGALFSIVIAAIAVVAVAKGDETIHVHMLIATALGVGFTMLMGIGLMTLMFLSNSMGHDDVAADHNPKDPE